MNKTPEHVWLWIILLIVPLAGSCREMVLDPQTPKQDPVCDYPQIVVRDGLDAIIVVEKDGVVTKVGPPLSITLPVRARSEKDVEVEYRFWFLSSAPARKPLDINPVWHHMLMPAQTQVFMSATALDRATEWRLEIRRARRH